MTIRYLQWWIESIDNRSEWNLFQNSTVNAAFLEAVFHRYTITQMDNRSVSTAVQLPHSQQLHEMVVLILHTLYIILKDIYGVLSSSNGLVILLSAGIIRCLTHASLIVLHLWSELV